MPALPTVDQLFAVLLQPQAPAGPDALFGNLYDDRVDRSKSTVKVEEIFGWAPHKTFFYIILQMEAVAVRAALDFHQKLKAKNAETQDLDAFFLIWARATLSKECQFDTPEKCAECEKKQMELCGEIKNWSPVSLRTYVNAVGSAYKYAGDKPKNVRFSSSSFVGGGAFVTSDTVHFPRFNAFMNGCIKRCTKTTFYSVVLIGLYFFIGAGP